MEAGSARLAPPWRPKSDLEDDYYPQGGWDTAFLVILLLTGLPANGLMAWLSGCQARRRAGKRLALFLLSLATSDFLFLVATAFQIMEIRLQGHWPLGTAACRFYYFLWGVSYSSGLFLLAALSLDRSLTALFPRWYPCRRPSRLPLWLCSGAWVLATLFSVPWLIFPEANAWWYDLVICLDFWDTEEVPLRVLEILGGLLPFLLLLLSHVLTQIQGCRLRRRQQPQEGRAGPPPAGFSRVASTILSAYVVLRLPYQLAQLLYLAYLWDFYPGYLLWEALVYSDYLMVLDSCLSPFLCLLASANARALLHSMLSSFAAALAEEQFGGAGPVASLPAQPESATVQLQPSPTSQAQPQAHPTAQAQVNPPSQPQPNLIDQPHVNPTAQPSEVPPTSTCDPTSGLPEEQPAAAPQEGPAITPAAAGDSSGDAPPETPPTPGPS
ncbi:probable G-protein coupled receptor 152 [Monodelphis domestica]|uniref:probable G-protein coupled receptor 152 n=1 Tax=Monodelphis domestica TaxID=13616 RepID=UPI0000F2E246|nr:probable G-protein coupled receptor 152 [Monodelphis domestica]XP_056659555.1 probable G-protein coupled receptor 152 [Monodelphis domestica]